MVCNTAVFYDIENLIGLFTVKNNTILHLDEIYRRIQEVEGVNGVSVQKAYADWAMQINRNLRHYVLQIGIEPVQIFNTNQNDKVKNAADVSLIIDAVELLSKRPDIENYVIVSGDGIFAFLAKKLHEHGKRVIGCGFNRNTNIIFKNACDYFITLEKSDKTLTATSSKNNMNNQTATVADETREAKVEALETPAVKAAPAVKKQEPIKKIPSRFPKNKFSEALANSDIEVWKNITDPIGTLHAIRNVVDTLFNGVPDDSANLEISVFKTYVDYYVPGLKLNQYKYKRFGEFMRFFLTGSPYCLYDAEGKALKIARRGAVGAKGSAMEDVKGLEVIQSDGTIVHSLFDVEIGSSFTYKVEDTSKVSVKQEPKSKAKRINQPKSEDVEISVQQPEATAQAPTEEAPTLTLIENADPETEDSEITGESGEAIDEGSVRKWIKGAFMRLSLSDVLTTSEVKRMMTAEYSQKTFGIKTPIFKEVLTRSNLTEQRTVNGKVKYWKESFKYNGKTYLIYKEWVATLHRDRFTAWLSKVEPKIEATGEQQDSNE